nr:PAS domain-containing protein [Hymenobacter nivis]
MPAIGAEQFTFLVDMIPQLVWITDAAGFHIYFNQRWTDFTGYTLAGSVGPDMWNNLLHPDDRARACDGATRWPRATMMKSSTASGRPMAATAGFWARPARGATPRGPLTTWFGTCTDIHGQKLVAEQLQSSCADLEAKVTFRNLELEHQVQDLQQLAAR